MEVLVVGAGASGLMAAIAAAREGAKVTLLEGMEKPGKKLLTTGNGRCNLTNRSVQDGGEYHTQNPKDADEVLKAFPARDTEDFFENLGLLLKTREESLVYPYSDQAQSVLDVLLSEAARWKVKIKSREKVVAVEKEEKRFLVKTEGWQYQADRVVLTTGSKAAAITGSDGSGYELAKSLGHSLIPVLPALVPLTVKEAFGKALEGVRSRAKLTLWINGKSVMTEQGEVQWTSYGISGIVVFQLSSLAVRALENGKKVQVEVDLLPDYEVKYLKEKLNERFQKGEGSYEALLGGFYHKKVFAALCKQLGVKTGQKAEFSKAVNLLETSKKLGLTIRGARSFEQAQVCSGGVPLEEVDCKTMESKKVRGLYLAGELLDVDGPCGGYNLQWAWASGYLAGSHSGKGAV